VASAAVAASAGASAAAAKPPKNGTQYVVAWITNYPDSNEYWKAFTSGVKGGIEAGGGKYVNCTAEQDPVKMLDCMDTILAMSPQPDAIINYCGDCKAYTPAIQKANTAGIPMFFFANTIAADAGVDVVGTVYISDTAAGAANATAIVAALTKKYGSPKGKVLNVTGDLTTPAGQARSQGALDVFAKSPDIKVTSKDGKFDTAVGTQVIQDWMTANPDTDALSFGSDGAYTPAAKAALTAIGRWVPAGDSKHVIIAGEDGTNLAVNAIKCGYMEETGDFALGDLGPQIARIVMDGLKTGKWPVEGDVYTDNTTLWKTLTTVKDPKYAGLLYAFPPISVTKDNAADPLLFANKYQSAPNGTSPCQ
jgi:ABC-type sugar transport system substrate-binding protein